ALPISNIAILAAGLRRSPAARVSPRALIATAQACGSGRRTARSVDRNIEVRAFSSSDKGFSR
ncbi:hypothetical protein, partial [Ferrovibrio sp.]|uniref:hypothetical protein n=1 Tax=Ferrovibrio sp. TaxID=1917215 RepID=UPI0035116803